MAANPVIWFEIYVDDIDRARAFYEAVLQVSLEKMANVDMEYWAFPMQGDQVGAGGALAKLEGVRPGGSGTLIYFSSADCAVEESRVAAAGGTVVRPKMSIQPYGFISLAVDTEGNTIGFHSQA